MNRIASALCAVALLAGATPALAQQRVYTRTLTCAAIRDLVARNQSVLLASSETTYEVVHLDGGVCVNDQTSAPAYEPSADQPNCFAGWRCTQRNSDGGSSNR